MMERFLEKCRVLLRGSTDDTSTTTKAHPHIDKINRLSGLFEDGWLHAGIYAIVDLWDAAYDRFFKFCKSPSQFGGFAAPHLRHHIAEQVAKDLIFYKEARANPVSTGRSYTSSVGGALRRCLGCLLYTSPSPRDS